MPSTNRRLKPWIRTVLIYAVALALACLPLLARAERIERRANTLMVATHCWTLAHPHDSLPDEAVILAWFADWSTGVNPDGAEVE